MKYILDSPTLEFFWAALNSSTRPARPFQARTTFNKIVALGWITARDFENIFHCLKPMLTTEFDAYQVSRLLGIQWEYFTCRSRAGQKDIFWHQGMRANDVALFLMLLEQIGFEFDASYLINLLKPKILTMGKRAFTRSELAIIEFEKKRHRQGELYLLADREKNLPLESKVRGRITTRLG